MEREETAANRRAASSNRRFMPFSTRIAHIEGWIRHLLAQLRLLTVKNGGMIGRQGYTLRLAAVALIVGVLLVRGYRPHAEGVLLIALSGVALFLPIVAGPRLYATILCLAAIGVAVVAPKPADMVIVYFVFIGMAGARLPLFLALPVAAVTAGLYAALTLRSGDAASIWPQLSWYTAAFALAISSRMRRVARARQTAMLAELARSNAELRAAHEQLRLDSERAVALAAAEERERIAREIHDVLAHTLTILVVQVGAVKRLVGRDPERAQQQLDLIAQLTRDGLAEVRRSIHELRSPDEEGVAALATLVREFAERTSVTGDFVTDPEAPALPAPLSKAFYRVTQEALTNAVRHGNARSIHVSLCRQDNQLILSIHDDGIGAAAAPPVAGGGNGLRGAAERLRAFDGAIAAQPLPAGGFQVSASVPLIALLNEAARIAPGNDLAPTKTPNKPAA